MSAILTKIANDPRQVLFLDDVIAIGRPEALGVKFLERLAREFEPVLALFENFLRRVHDVEISLSRRCEQAANS